MRTLTRRDAAKRSEAGFTLVEMIIAVSVLAMVVLAVSTVFDSGVRALAAAKARARANDIATDGIEDLQRFSFNNLALCQAPPGTPPAGLESSVLRDCTAEAVSAFTNPCAPGTAATVPDEEYVCVDNNVSYSVKRYVAWVDALRTTKRLAVFVEWTDLAGNHQVSQQSSLRAPDQAAVTGLAPPKFTSVTLPTPASLSIDDDGHLTTSLTMTANTSSLNTAAETTLQTSIPAHVPNDQFTVNVADFAGFPTFNGFPVGIGSETFRVVLGAGTPTWTVAAEGLDPHSAGVAVRFAGDKVYAEFQSIGPNGLPHTSTLFLKPPLGSIGTVSTWSATLGPNVPTIEDPLEFGVGKQYVSFGILRATDGKSTATFASTVLEFCHTSGCPDASTPTPSVDSTSVAGGTNVLDIDSSGALSANVALSATTTNVTSSDSVWVSFLTQAGTKTVLLSLKSGTTCGDSATAVAPATCQWDGVISKEEGYLFSSDPQSFYFAAQQVDDNVNAGSIDNGSTAVANPHSVTFS